MIYVFVVLFAILLVTVLNRVADIITDFIRRVELVRQSERDRKMQKIRQARDEMCEALRQDRVRMQQIAMVAADNKRREQRREQETQAIMAAAARVRKSISLNSKKKANRKKNWSSLN